MSAESNSSLSFQDTNLKLGRLGIGWFLYISLIPNTSNSFKAYKIPNANAYAYCFVYS